MRRPILAASISLATLTIFMVSGVLLANSYYAQFNVSTSTVSAILPSLASHTAPFDVTLDSSYLIEGSGPGEAEYWITGTPKCLLYEGFDCVEFTPDLCNYLSITSTTDTEETEYTQFLVGNDWYKVAQGVLVFEDHVFSHPNDLSDGWSVAIHAPCFEGECPVGYDAGIHGTPLPQSLKGQTFTCDLNVDTGYFPISLRNILAPDRVYAQSEVNQHIIEVSAVFSGVEETPACTENCNSNVMFLPGLEASRLYRPWVCSEDGCRIRLWEPSSDSLMEQLFLGTDGESNNSDIYTQDILDRAFQNGPQFYDSFIKQMNQMATSGLIHEWEAIPYDWRLSAERVLSSGKKYSDGRISYLEATSSPYILQEINRLAQSSRTGKVTIIAHSNGGIITKTLMQKLETLGMGNLVDKIILVAVPQTGTPQALGALLHGYEQGIPVLFKDSTARTLGENMPSGYQLLPSEAYFTGVGSGAIDPVITFEPLSSNTGIFRTVFGNEIMSKATLDAFLLGYDGRQKPAIDNLTYPNILNTHLLADSNSAHNSYDVWLAPSTTQIYQIAGWGVDTLKTIHYTQGGFFHCFGVNPCLDYDPVTTEDGDGTVVVASALAMSTSTQNVKRYWVDLLAFFLEHDSQERSHADILEVPQLLSFIRSVVLNSSGVLPEYISASAPKINNQDKHLRYYLHSPLSLGVYNSQGRFTGASSTTGQIEHGIPGAYYKIFGDVKYISVPASSPLTLVMNGEASGGFTLKIEEVQGGTVVGRATFADIPSSTTTFAHMIFPNGTISGAAPLTVDTEGDGTTDFSLIPKLNDIVTYVPVVLDTTPPTTTVSTMGTLGNNGWHASNVLVALSATDTESGVASTTYSLNNGVTWLEYFVPVSFATEGTTTILYHAIDNAGNTEDTSSLTFKIDKTAPEAKISVSTSTQDLLVEGVDTLGTTTLTKDTTGNYIISDQAGHTTKLFFQKTFTGKRLTYAKLTGVQYDQAPKTILPSSSFLYVWDTKVTAGPVSQTIAVDGTYLLQASYDRRLNKTIVIVLKKGIPIQTKSFTGLRIVRLTTLGGVVGYEL